MKISNNQKTDHVGVQIVGEMFESAGYIFREQTTKDFGIDAQIEVVDGDIVTGKLIALQIKSGSSWFKEKSDDGFIYRGDIEHLEYWLDHSLPVLIVLCDTQKRKCFWQSVTPANITYTKKAWKTTVPKYQQINAGMYVDLQYLVNKLRTYKSYTIGSFKDLSHGVAKRYCLRIILNKEHTQSEIVDHIKNITREAINTDYHRSDITRNHWRNIPAHVIWLDIFPSSEDEQNNNYICQTEWFSKDLDPEYLPISNNGEEISENLKAQWNDEYLKMSRFYADNTIGKEEFILKVTQLIDLASSLTAFAYDSLEKYKKQETDLVGLKNILAPKSDEIDKVYFTGTDIGLSPYECKDVSTKFQSLIAYAHNVYLPFSSIGSTMDEQQIVYNITSQSKYYLEALEEFNFEVSKVK